jgi:hypothetical protein
MTRLRKVESDTPVLRGSGVLPIVEQYKQTKKMKDMWEKKEKELRSRLMSILEDEGVPDDKGHLWLELPEAVDGTSKLQRMKRVSQVLDQSLAEKEIGKLGLWEECVRTIEVVDEDAILALAFEKRIPESLMTRLYEENVTWALYLR